jgi:hypothetical protein
MRFKRFLLVLVLISHTPCYAYKIIVVSSGGAEWKDVHDVVKEEATSFGYSLREGDTYTTQDPGPWYSFLIVGEEIPIASEWQAEELRTKVNALVTRNGGDKSNLSLILVGKSAGGILIWNTVRLLYNDFDDFHRLALVLIDPHGAAYGDGKVGPYCDIQDLWWPSDWSSDRDVLRVYNIYQQESGVGMSHLTGASFPDPRVVENKHLEGPDINHENITKHQKTHDLIQEAFIFASGSFDWLVPVILIQESFIFTSGSFDWLVPVIWNY